jgi:hypothetical protein
MHGLPLILLALLAPPDTVVAVEAGDRLSFADLDGDLTVVAWGRDEVRLQDLDAPEDELALTRRGRALALQGARRKRDLRLEVPAWLPLEFRGGDVDVSVRGTSGGLTVRTLDGRVELEGVSGSVDVQTVSAEIHARDLNGSVRLRTGNEDISVAGARGSLAASAADADLTFVRVELDTLDAVTTDGDVSYAGVFLPAGSYTLSTHDGDVIAAVPGGADVTVEVSTFSGAFEADFPVKLDPMRSGRRATFTLGTGGARLIMETFDGDVRLVRPEGVGGRPDEGTDHNSTRTGRSSR